MRVLSRIVDRQRPVNLVENPRGCRNVHRFGFGGEIAAQVMSVYSPALEVRS